MSLKHQKKKQPKIIRANLLAAAAELIVERGWSGLTLDLVAQKAGVSKGGLIHHFSSKQALLESLHHEILEEYESLVGNFIANDPEPQGRFIRACIKAHFTPLNFIDSAKLFNALTLEISHNEILIQSCRDWYEKLVEKYGEKHQSLKSHMLQYAADGIWMEYCTGIVSISPEERQTMIDYLIQQTYEL